VVRKPGSQEPNSAVNCRRELVLFHESRRSDRV
jgi:hypothetical protein